MEQPIGIIGAMDIEVTAILQMAEIVGTDRHGGLDFHLAVLSGVPVVVARCYEGKVNAALCAQAMIDFYRPRAILNVGIAGGVGPDVHIGDVVVASHFVQYDFDSTALGAPLAQLNVSGQPEPVIQLPCDRGMSRLLELEAGRQYSGTVHYGPVATGDRFVASGEVGNWLHQTFGALACEMEGGAISQVCLANGVPCVALRSISDNANDSDTVDFRTFAEDSADKAQRLLKEVIGEL